jgi:lipopolysaccharide export system protein LptC
MTRRIVSNGAMRACLLLLIIAGFFYLGSCRKTDTSGRTNMATKKDVPEWVMEKIRNTPPGFMVGTV